MTDRDPRDTTMITTLLAGQNATQTVTTSVLRVFGASSWTGADANSGQQRSITVSNVGASVIYIQVVTATATLTGSVSASDYLVTLSAGGQTTIRLAPNQTLAVLSASSSVVRASEVIEVA